MRDVSQMEFIKETLRSKKEISRNFCLRNYISRLGARICDLEREGWIFTTERREGDYVYLLAYDPENPCGMDLIEV